MNPAAESSTHENDAPDTKTDDVREPELKETRAALPLQEPSKKALPKFAVFAFVATTVLVGVLWLIRAALVSSEDEQSASTVSNETKTFTLPYPVQSPHQADLQMHPTDPSPSSKADSDPAGGIPNSLPDTDSAHLLSEVTQNLDQLIESQSRLADAVQSESQRQAANSQALLSPIMSRISFLEERLTSLETSIASLAAMPKQLASLSASIQRRTPVKKPVPEKPSFHLVSVDSWGSDSVAVFELGGRAISKGLGESLSGWSVLSLDLAKQSVTVRKGNRRHTMTVEQ